MGKSAYRICENKDAYQLRGNREADRRRCFRYTASTIPLLQGVPEKMKPVFHSSLP